MPYQFPPDVERLVQEQMTASGYGSQDELLRDALRLFRELQIRNDELKRDVQFGVEQADQGRATALNLDELIERCTRKLAAEGITD
jgi:Arc/MetJ-type ribon-helix-helix transcriptional regulator